MYNRYWIAWFLAVVYATTDECHQLFVPDRAGRVTDVMIDALGAAIALGALAVVLLCVKMRTKHGICADEIQE